MDERQLAEEKLSTTFRPSVQILEYKNVFEKLVK
jgi:hypothetical protein